MRGRLQLLCLVVPGLLVAVIAWVEFGRGVSLHQDEAYWIGSAYYFDLLVRGDLDHRDWRRLPARENPPVGKYLCGAVLWACGRPVRSIEPLASHYAAWAAIPGAWGTGVDAEERRAVAERLTPEVRLAVQRNTYRPIDGRQLVATRLLAAAFGVVCAIAVASLGCSMRAPATGLLAGTIFAAHPLAVAAYTHALFDVIALAFSALAVRSLIGVRAPLWAVAAGRARTVAMGTVAGILMGLAVGTKLNALVLVALATLLLGLEVARAWWRTTGDGAAAAVALGLSVVVGLAVFVAVNPALYPDVIEGLRDCLAVPARTTKLQASFLPGFLGTTAAKWAALGQLLCGHWAGLVMLAVLALVPTCLAWREATGRRVVVLWWWLALVMVALWIPFPWSRYALPVLPPAALVFADSCLAILGRFTPPPRSLARPRDFA